MKTESWHGRTGEDRKWYPWGNEHGGINGGISGSLAAAAAGTQQQHRAGMKCP
jgi:hypothetical protein